MSTFCLQQYDITLLTKARKRKPDFFLCLLKYFAWISDGNRFESTIRWLMLTHSMLKSSTTHFHTLWFSNVTFRLIFQRMFVFIWSLIKILTSLLGTTEFVKSVKYWHILKDILTTCESGARHWHQTTLKDQLEIEIHLVIFVTLYLSLKLTDTKINLDYQSLIFL